MSEPKARALLDILGIHSIESLLALEVLPASAAFDLHEGPKYSIWRALGWPLGHEAFFTGESVKLHVLKRESKSLCFCNTQFVARKVPLGIE